MRNAVGTLSMLPKLLILLCPAVGSGGSQNQMAHPDLVHEVAVDAKEIRVRDDVDCGDPETSASLAALNPVAWAEAPPREASPLAFGLASPPFGDSAAISQITRAAAPGTDGIPVLSPGTSAMLTSAAAAAPVTPQTPSSPTFSFQLGLGGLFSLGFSDADNEELDGIQGGAHDPNRNGFTIQNVELSMIGEVDPYFDAKAFIVFQIDKEGETVIELEEIFFTTRGLPGGLQLKGGQFFTEFGRQNYRHPHQWNFSDQPVILSRFFGGDGLRSQGLRLSWLLPTNGYSEVLVGLQNAKGETAHSFLSVVGEQIGGYELAEQSERNFADLLYSARWLTGTDLSDTTSLNLGLSALSGPNATGPDNNTQIFGGDFYLKWQAATSNKGFPFFAVHGEWLSRRYEAGPERVNLKDNGGFCELVWGYSTRKLLGLRAELADAKDRDPGDPFRDRRYRFSVNWTWFPTEFSKLRLQYNRDRVEHLADRDLNSVWLSMEFNLGKHLAHTF